MWFYFIMSTVTTYLNRFVNFPALLQQKPSNHLKLVVVIPCFNEPDLIKSLISLDNCIKPGFNVEVIIVINSPANASEAAKRVNQLTKKQVERWIVKKNKNHLIYHLIYLPNLPPKHAGVGLARKIGMDEALRRLSSVGEGGIICGFDADTICDDNYFIALEKHFFSHQSLNACSIYFEHPLYGDDYDEKVYDFGLQYDLHLRYYVHAMRYAGFPYAYHTVGSSFAVKAEVYAKQGGMNRRKAGEDFYFLHKIIPLGNYHDLTSTRIQPSPRPSDRVPFGTGAAINKLLASKVSILYTYHPDAFEHLKSFFYAIPQFCNHSIEQYSELINSFPAPLKEFLMRNDYLSALKEAKTNSTTFDTFKKRILQWFTAFRILKYLNFVHENDLEKISILNAAEILLKRLGLTTAGMNRFELVEFYRQLDREKYWP